MCEPVVRGLRLLGSGVVGTVSSHHADLLNEAADILDFFFGQMRLASVKMDGQHSWRLANGYPMTMAIGATPTEAVRHAIDSVKEDADGGT